MSDHIFGVRKGKLTALQQTAERIAERHVSTFVYADLPGHGYRSWFTTRNDGEPSTAQKRKP
ncbi:MAG TPA: hypothetical protein VFN67_13130 [Polyangiales bacterium]|nr:hypothetical protein [Polyangiales bacterium]